MKASIVIPAYNEEASIEHALRAALAQDHDDFEVIVVNNASADRTVEIVSQFPVKLVHESRKGLLWAREAGRKAAQGDVIANMDADCRPQPDWLSRGLKHFNDERIVAVTGPYDYHDATRRSFRMSSLLTQRYIYKPVSVILQLPFINGGAILIGGNNLIRAHILEKTSGYNTDLAFYGEDTDTAKRVARHGTVLFNTSFIMKTSARRYEREGILNLQMKYLFHFFKHIFKKKTASA